MTKIKPLKWLLANNTIYAAPSDCKFIYYIKSIEDGTFVLDQLDIVNRHVTSTFHQAIADAKKCADQLYTNYLGCD